jgi:hypothetical protein
LRQRCAKLYAQLRDGALAFLITADWLQAEAAAQGVSVSPSEVDAGYRQLLNGPAGPSFARRLRRAGMTRADELLQVRIERLAQKLRTKIGAGRPQLVSAFIAAYRKRWKQRTTCQPGYIVAECRNGPTLPASPKE